MGEKKMRNNLIKWRVWLDWKFDDLKTSLYFIIVAWKCFRSKMGVMDSREVVSKGGYRYLQIELSPLPVTTKGWR